MAIQYTPALSLPYPQVTDAPLIASRDLRALAQKMDSEGAQIRGESSAALTAGQAAEALAAQALARANAIEDPIHVGPSAPTEGEELWVDTDEDAPPAPVSVASEDITDATTVGRNVLTAPLTADGRRALNIWDGTRAHLDEGTDTSERTWEAKDLAEFVASKVENAAGAASWDDLAGKPSTFPPEAHTHDDRYYTEAEVDAKIAAALTAQLADLAYDSGELDITSLAGSRVTGGKFLIRRVGKLVTFSVVGVAPSSTLGSGSVVLTIPAGFRRPSRWDGYIQAGVNTFRSVFILGGGGLGVWAPKTSDSWRIDLSWVTDDPIPV